MTIERRALPWAYAEDLDLSQGRPQRQKEPKVGFESSAEVSVEHQRLTEGHPAKCQPE